MSLLERILATKNYKDDSSILKTQLLDNYRSHTKILELPNKTFYESKLRSKISAENGNFALNWNSLPNKEVPILLHPIFNVCKKDRLSFYNVDEITTVKSYVDSLLEDGINSKTVSQGDIGIVSPYNAQILRLKETFSKQQKIEIGTAEHFQGREKKIIIISAVKSGQKFPVGFLANEKVP